MLQKTVLSSLVLLALIFSTARAEGEALALKGIRHRNETVQGELTRVSMAGGLQFFVDGKGFDDMPAINQVQFDTTQGTPVTRIGKGLNIDDQIQSATVLGRLAYTMPAMVDLLNGPIMGIRTSYIANDKSERVSFRVKVANTAEATDSVCPKDIEKKCEVHYSWRYTPLLHDTVPSQVFWQQQVSFVMNAMGANQGKSLSAANDPVDFIKINGTRCDQEGWFDYTRRLDQFRIDALNARVGDQKPGKSEPEVRFRVGNAFLRETAKHCNFKGDDCWFIKTHPKITSVSAAEGYTTGGQTLTINGWGLKTDKIADVDVKVDGVACKVVTQALDKITCVTGAAAGASHEGEQPGSPGLRQKVIDPTNTSTSPYFGMTTDGKHPVVETNLLTSWEDYYGNYTRAATSTKGWFKAPEAGKYRFYSACDDQCRTWLSSTKWDKAKKDEYKMDMINYRYGWTSWRHYHHPQTEGSSNKWVSDWITLEKDQYYKIESAHLEWTGRHDHSTVSVEFEKADTKAHHHATKEVQLLEVDSGMDHEKFNITVKNAMGGKFQITFVNPKYQQGNPHSKRTITSREVKDNDAASSIQWAVQDFYGRWDTWGTSVSVTKLETNDKYETVEKDGTQIVYQVSVTKAISDKGFAAATIVKAKGTTSDIKISDIYQQSSPPLTGNFIIECTDENGSKFATREMGFNEDTDLVSLYMTWEIPHLMMKTYVYDSGKYPYRQNGLEFAVVFQDLHADPAQCTIKTGVTKAMEGGKSITFKQSTSRPYGQNLMFEPVPLEMLYHDAAKPQVLVKIKGIEGLCPGFNCDYLYKAAPSEITAQALANEKELTITGTSLPTENVRVVLGNAECGTVTAEATKITCTLKVLPAAGSWDVKVYEPKGLVPIKAGTAKISVALVVTKVDPATPLNQLGGDVLTLTGKGFDSDTSQTSVKFSDDTKCDVESATPEELKCKVAGFKKEGLNAANPYNVIVLVNNIENKTKNVNLLSTKQSGQTVTPNSVNPVLASTLTVQLENTYPGDMTKKENFSAKLVSEKDATVTRPLYVKSVDKDKKQVVIKFPGSKSGVYYLALEGKGVGRIDQTPLKLTAESVVNSISPLKGSHLGGTLVTITGTNFSTNKLDNPVKAGPFWCYVESSTVSEIKCRVAETGASKDMTGKFSVFLRTQEEMKYKDGLKNDYAFEAPKASVTGLTAAFDAASNTQKLTLAGTGFGTDKTAVSLYIDGQKQTTDSAANTEAKFTLTHLDSETANVVKVYFADGLPTGHDKIKTVAITPNLVSITPATGSVGGTLLTVTGTGFGKKTKSLTLVDGADKDVCATVEIKGYGSFTCLTKPGEMLKSSKLKIKTDKGKYACGNSDATKCDFEQIKANSPTVTGVTLTNPTTLTIAGTGFPDSGYTATVVFKGVESTSATISSKTAVTATFAKGVPVSKDPAAPVIKFAPSSRRMLGGISNFMQADLGTVKLTSAVSVTASTENLQCSFQGGCPYEVTGNGLTSTLKVAGTADHIDVCGERCVLDEAASTASKAVCTLPHVTTTYSTNQYKVTEAGVMHTGTWSGTASAQELKKLTDDKNLEDLKDDTASNCYFQIKYTDAHVGVLDEVKFFVNNLLDKTPFIGMKFQGSNDGSAFTDLWTVDEEVHEGWNIKDWEAGKKPAYNIYRFQGKVKDSCRVGEVRLNGLVSIQDNNPTYQCTPKLVIDGAKTDLNKVTFSNAKTPKLTKMSTRFASVLGNESIQFEGTGFSDSAVTKVTIDNRDCAVTAKTTTKITCTTSNKPYVKDTPKLVINIQGTGNVATLGKTILYVSKWSAPETWGGDLSPQDGEAISVPKGQHLLFDIDTGPKLSFANVEGSLIFPPSNDANHQRKFDAHYILVKNGYMEVGTEENRYTSKMTITLWSTKYDPQIPIFGNKVIGVNYGTLEMHGISRPITWTNLKATADKGATSITLMDMKDGKSLDWKVGEEIVIAPTTYSGRDAEQRTIKSITNIDSAPVITFDGPLLTKHYSGVQTFGDDSIEMRAEVGLLTRNIKFKGDDEHSPDNQYGAVIICHSPGDESTVCRIDNVELTLVGQAFILGSYPIHFHMIGTVHKSYVRNNAIHHSFNRAVTIHGVHYLRVQNNVAYHTMGHTIFIEDGVETKNLIEGNLILDVRRSWSLLNTDQTPASIWITNPDNIIRNNACGGSDRYSYWYDLQETAIGPSYDVNVCPENQKLGEFKDNVAHSNGRYGLRIFHNHIPRQKQCDPINYDDTSAKYNPPIPAKYYNLISYKNKRNGAIVERAGAVEWHNFKTADNLEVGMEMSRTDDNMRDGYAKIVGGLVVGKSENTEEALDKASPFGVRTPRTEWFTMTGVKFYNYNWNSAAGMSTCSHCWHDNNTDSGGRTMTVSDLKFDDATVPKRVSYGTPFRTIFFDKSGGLSGRGANSWFLPYFKHLLVTECKEEKEKGGITCDNTVQARRVAIFGLPNNFWSLNMSVLQISEADEKAKRADKSWQAFKDNKENYAIIPFKEKQDPMNGWALPYITGHRYRIHWGQGLDFDTMKIEMSTRWEENDKNIWMAFNFTEKREAVNITTNYGGAGKVQIENNTLASGTKSGDYQLRNQSDWKEFEILLNGKDKTREKLLVRPLECIQGQCPIEAVADMDLPVSASPWSDAKTWGGKLPVDGDEVEITNKMWVELDLAETPKLKKLTINGRLTVKSDAEKLKSIKLRSFLIWVRAGELLVGDAEKPFEQDFTVEMLGETESDTLQLDGFTKAGNKVMVSNNKIAMYGKRRTNISRMLETAQAGATKIKVAADVDWKVGEQIFIATSTLHFDHSERKVIKAIDKGVIELTEPLKNYHFGAEKSTGDIYNGVDVRNEVLLLTRNVKIMGEKKDSWAGHVLVSDLIEGENTRNGYLILDGVEVDNCSQKDYSRGAIRFENALGKEGIASKITHSTIHDGNDWALMINRAKNIEVSHTTMVGWRAFGVVVDNTENMTFNNNFVGDVLPRQFDALGMLVDKEACVAMGSQTNKMTPLKNLIMKDNIAGGCAFAGFVAPAITACGGSFDNMKGNVAHSSTRYGAHILENPLSSTSETCVEWGYYSAYKTREACLVSVLKTKKQKVHHVTCVDVQEGFSPNYGGAETEETEIVVEDSTFFGESAAQDCPNKDACWCQPKYAVQSSHCNLDKKDPHPTAASALPVSKSKAQGAWGGKVTYNRCKFENFIGKSMCGERSVIFERNKYDSDKIPQHYFNDCTFKNVDNSGWAFLEKPPTAWANVKDCGNFPCTAPNNLIFTFKGTKFEGETKPTTAVADFVIVPDDKTVGGTYPSCDHFKDQQIYVCQINNIGMLQFENLDTDGWDRAIQPVYLRNKETGFENKLNAMMDHIWDTFYTGQKRMPRFPAALLTGQDYDLEFSGTPPKKIRINLDARSGGTKIRIPYPVAGTYQVAKREANGSYTRVQNNAWDDTISKQGEIKKTAGCGENRFVGVDNYLEFYIEAGCDLQISPKDSIQAKVRMDWSMDEFFSNGGTTRFVDRLASSLGIDSYRIKVVSVYKGSVVVDFQIETPTQAETKKDENGNVVAMTPAEVAAQQAAAASALANVKNVLVQQANSGALNVGAPVMGLEAKNDSGQAELLAGTPIPAAPTGNPAIIMPDEGAASRTPGGSIGLAVTWIAMLALLANLF